jgi:proteasome lid subunit RPN8/RPN11
MQGNRLQSKEVETTTGDNTGAPNTWSAPECRYRVDYSARVLDDIRLAVIDAFFSLPRGGAEIGGILLGQVVDGAITIQDYQALDCEHATGPSFTLSERDRLALAEMTAAADENHGGLRVVGWYHSHTRSEIFLSEADQEIHNLFFPEPWQVALVIKPHTFQPARCGIFFREPDGSIRSGPSYNEFVLEALPMPPAAPGKSEPNHKPLPFSLENAFVPGLRNLTSGLNGEPLATAGLETGEQVEPSEPEIRPDPEETHAPQFLELRPGGPWKWVIGVLAAVAGVAIGSVIYQTREAWVPVVGEQIAPLLAKIQPGLPRDPDKRLSLQTVDFDGQLHIRWDAHAPAIARANLGRLLITDGTAGPKEMELDAEHLRGGEFTYLRVSERVDVALVVNAGTSQEAREVTSFLGSLPDHRTLLEDPAVRKERDDLREQASKLKQDLSTQASRTRRLEKELQDVRDEMRSDPRHRPGTPATGAGK